MLRHWSYMHWTWRLTFVFNGLAIVMSLISLGISLGLI